MHEETLVPGVELLEAMRSVGYSFNAACADIIDNSIAAGATNIEVIADTTDGSYVCFFDNGSGMAADDAREALKLAGTRNLERGENDLGRFGLGLKTASLSQGRRLTVVTKKDSATSALQWDLDFVLSTASWSIRVLDAEDVKNVPQSDRVSSVEHGTLVVWESLDLLIAGAHDVSSWMSSRLATLRTHLGLVFHRFLEGRNSIQLAVNGINVTPIDPFLQSNSKTQVSPIENVTIGAYPVTVEAFTLPHASNLSAKERKREDLGPRMRDHQGFYVYRNRRLISAGSWFGLSKQDELSKQTRVRVDIPPELDHHWRLDIKKSRVEPPQAFQRRFRQIIDQVKAKSTRVHTFRGRSASPTDFTFYWRLIEGREGFHYAVDPAHPAVVAVRSALPERESVMFDDLLADLAMRFPLSDAYARVASNQAVAPTELKSEQVIARLRALRASGVRSDDLDAMSAALGRIEPFNTVPDLHTLVVQVWKESE